MGCTKKNCTLRGGSISMITMGKWLPLTKKGIVFSKFWYHYIFFNVVGFNLTDVSYCTWNQTFKMMAYSAITLQAMFTFYQTKGCLIPLHISVC